MTVPRRCEGARALVATAALLTGFVVAGCAASAPRETITAPGRPSAASAEDLRIIQDAELAMRAKEAELHAAHAEAVSECARACTLQDNICTLAERICTIAAGYPPTDAVAARCADGRARCRRAREAVRSRCTCGSPAP